jgi:hypothetical protein
LQGFDRENYILVTFWPATVGTQPSVLDVPHREPATGEIGGDVVLEVASVTLPPAASVDEDDTRSCTTSRREPEVGDLLPVSAVRNGLG